MATKKPDETVVEEADDGSIIVDGEEALGPPTGKSFLPVKARFKTEDLAEINSFEDLHKIAASLGEEIVDSSDVGSGFVVVDKDRLVNRRLMILDWKESFGGKFGNAFMSVNAMLEHPINVEGRQVVKVVFTDGSSGIAAALRAFSKKYGRTGFIDCPNGLRASTYTTQDENGRDVESTTYYF